MPHYKALQTIAENDVIPYFAYEGPYPVQRGTFVKITSGFLNDQNLDLIGSPGASYANTVSQRWGIKPKVAKVNGSGDATIGFLKFDGKEIDENGLPLKFFRQKADEMQVFQTGQSANIVRKAIVYYSGIAGTPTAGAIAYLGTDGGLNTSGSPLSNPTVTKVGQFLGPKDKDGFALVAINVT